MSLDVYLEVVKPTKVFSKNITHNLNKMAEEVLLPSGLTLYQVLWRPDEHDITTASQMIPLLENAYIILSVNPKKFKVFNPENKWGSYEGLLDFVEAYIAACRKTPEATVRVSR